MSFELDGDIRLEEKPDGDLDIWSSCADLLPSSPPDHLLVMVHGILGSTNDWLFGAKQFVESFPGKIIVHCSECNMRRLTLDGVDVMGERLAEEVADVINSRSELKKISFVAHSVGGLVARYAIGRLYRPIGKVLENSDCTGKDDTRGTIYGLQAINFISTATPHLGSRGNRQVPFLFGLTAIETLASRVVHWIFRRTGRHLFLTDNDDGEPPLLLRMVNDCSGLHFMSALLAFKRRVLYANAGCDHIVGWRTSSIRRNSELPKWDLALSQKYPHIVYEENSVGGSRNDTQVSPSDWDYEEKMVTGLSRVSWEKVDVSFHRSKQWIAAHSVIQVKYSFMQSEGADVIQHMIDHFIV